MKGTLRIIRRLIGGTFILAGLAALVPYSCVRVGSTHDGFGLPVYRIPTWVTWVFNTDSDWHGWLGILIFIGWLVWMSVGLAIYGATDPAPSHRPSQPQPSLDSLTPSRNYAEEHRQRLRALQASRASDTNPDTKIQ
jgi:hypothetical protein